MSDSTQTPVNLDINTLVNLLRIVDFAFAEGTFKGVDAVRGVLQERDKLAAFLDSLPKPDAAATPDASATG